MTFVDERAKSATAAGKDADNATNDNSSGATGDAPDAQGEGSDRGRDAVPIPVVPAGGRTYRSTLAGLVALMRPGQWPKNFLVVPLPLLGAPWSWSAAGNVAAATAAFVLASSLVYVVNDMADVERDRRHPVKRHRPLASGRVRMPAAVAFGGLQAVLLVLLLALLSPEGTWAVLLYLAVNAAYSWRLKHLHLLDVFIVATGFVLRLLGGYEASGRPVAGWLVLTVLTLCLLLILGKRRHELSVSGTGHRPALAGYSAHFLDLVLVMCSALTMVSYLLFLRTESGYAPAALLTAPCALFALFRYLQIVVVKSEGGTPVRTLLRDPVMLANSSVWAALLLLFQAV
ncbi:UbiA prenyltransferase family protein [Streptomyces sp. NPDC058632]|uniref:UbiA prenyltransferase family protein n=1 Tax=unclassified Streptomyces TaxID=2593676 RepID=UPI00364B449F